MNTEFKFEYTEKGCLKNLQNNKDIYEMNWVAGEIPWGTAEIPEGVSISRMHRVTERDTLEESFLFTNSTQFPVFFKETDIGIYLSLPDSYEEAGECMLRHCHTHLWCGKEAAWIMALRMSGIGPHLGLILRKGSIASYSVRRNNEKLSNDRGSFLLHPEVTHLLPGESYELRWELFWFERQEEFQKKLLEYENMPVVIMKQCTFFQGENAEICVEGKGKPFEIEVICDTPKESAKSVAWEKKITGDVYYIKADIPMQYVGEYKIDIIIDGVHTKALLNCCPHLERLMEKRCRFIAEKHQETVGSLNGGYLIYDNETGKRYYSHLDDHNGGRERVAMGTLIALWLQSHADDFLEISLKRYIEYVYRELLNPETGDVYNDINRNHEWDRLYNYPWMTIFLMEVYKWSNNQQYLSDAYQTMIRYYEKGGKEFYAIGIPGKEMTDLLHFAGMEAESEKLTREFLEHAECVRKTGLDFPKSEVNYEQSIVAPAVSILLQAYEMNGEVKFLTAAQEMLKVLELFNGAQPDYHMFENAIRHWDGYWFGKRRCLGDTFPHYWSVLTGLEYFRYGRITENKEYIRRGKASLRGCLNLFGADGTASCAMVYPASINGKTGHFYDPWANDQDWALYYAWKMKNEENRV